MKDEKKVERLYFSTVDWCDAGRRGIFCDADGRGFSKEEAHTDDEMWRILGPFTPIVAPRSEPFTVEQVAEFNRWIPLAEYSERYGVALEGGKS